jgi:hypothetical protein
MLEITHVKVVDAMCKINSLDIVDHFVPEAQLHEVANHDIGSTEVVAGKRRYANW